MEDMVKGAPGKAWGFDSSFWRGKKVWVSGHTGFKGAWLCLWLSKLGARVQGASMPSPARESFAWQSFAPGLSGSSVEDVRLDIRDSEGLRARLLDFKPDVAFHLAAQAIVLDSYADASGTWSTNVMGSLNAMEAAKGAGCRAFVCVTSDKCYKNKSWDWGYRESDELGGKDPYSASKAACEILAASFRDSQMGPARMGVATARAGNVIGGGDNAPWRIVPEMLAAFSQGVPGEVRNPWATRPYQHALEPLSGYLLLGRGLFEGRLWEEGWNFGPGPGGEATSGWLASELAKAWGGSANVLLGQAESNKLEASTLMLDSSKARKSLGWIPSWDAREAVSRTVEWEKARQLGMGLAKGLEQVESFMLEAGTR